MSDNWPAIESFTAISVFSPLDQINTLRTVDIIISLKDSPLKWENALWYTTAFSSNSSSLRPVFLANTELSFKGFTELMSTTEYLSTSEHS